MKRVTKRIAGFFAAVLAMVLGLFGASCSSGIGIPQDVYGPPPAEPAPADVE